jgi:hypothetical protein
MRHLRHSIHWFLTRARARIREEMCVLSVLGVSNRKKASGGKEVNIPRQSRGL